MYEKKCGVLYMSENVSWAEQEKQQLTEDWEKTKKEKGLLDFFALKKGENLIVLKDISQKPELKSSDYGMQYVFKIQARNDKGDMQDYLFGVKQESYLWKLLVTEIAQGKNGFKLLKSGEKLSTRYELLSSDIMVV